MAQPPPVTSLVLPDCRARPRELALGSEQKAALLAAIATGGPDAVERWLQQEQQRDPRIRERLAAHAQAIAAEARERRLAREKGLRGRQQALRSAWEEDALARSRREAELMARLGAATVPEVDLTEALLRSVPPRRPGPMRRIWAWLVATWAMVVRAWVRLVRRVRGLAPATSGARTAGIDAGRLLRERPELASALRLQLGRGRSRWRRAWDHLSGRSDYDDELRELAQREASAEQAEAERRAREEAARVEQELERMRREDAAERARRQAQERGLEDEQERAAREEADELARGPLQALRQELVEDLRTVGLVDERGRATSMLLERFAAGLQQEAFASLPGGGQATPGHYAGGEGEYERGPMRSLQELGAIELSGSLVQARTRHPRVRHLMDEDVLVHRELRQSHAHVVIVLDTSGSMEEHGRLEAAKRVALVLHRMVRQMGAEHRVDLLLMSTSVGRADLQGVWDAKAGGFTNFSAALRQAHALFGAAGADRRVLYIVTDGLPEAMTLPDGRDVADSPRVCLPDAVAQAQRLARSGDVRLVVYQLEGTDQQFVDAARRIAGAAKGRVEVLDPRQLMHSLVVELQQAVAGPALADAGS